MKKKEFIAIGLMSGTSMDGVDLSVIKSDGNYEFTSIFDDYSQFDDMLKKELIKLRKKINSLDDLKTFSKELSILEREITLFHGKLISKISKTLNQNIDLIGFHGQTIFHNSQQKISKQLGDGKLLSQLTKKIVINNFRENDIKNGGEGAPLTPIFHNLISRQITLKNQIKFPINIINIGGISNITSIIQDQDNLDDNIFARDIGPGNCMIDEWIRKNSKKNFDIDGNIANSGNIDKLIINQAKDNFAIKSYEKSLDINDFDISFLKGLSLEDGSATLTDFTAYLISKGIEYTIEKIKNTNGTFLICGGGRKNNFLINSIEKYLFKKKIKLKNINDFGFNGDFIESQAFGYLAIRSFLGLPISFPKTTGCKSPTLGGVLNKNF